jgi:hypothetical protein
MRPLIVLLLVLGAAVALIVALQSPGKHEETVARPEAPAPAATQQGGSSAGVKRPEGGQEGRGAVAGVEPAQTSPIAVDPAVDNKLVGHVFGAQGAPLVDATVLLSRDALLGDDLHMRQILGIEPKGKPIQTKTNNKGEYVFRKVEPARDYYVFARHPDYAQKQ